MQDPLRFELERFELDSGNRIGDEILGRSGKNGGVVLPAERFNHHELDNKAD
jgi:hypothetical protein